MRRRRVEKLGSGERLRSTRGAIPTFALLLTMVCALVTYAGSGQAASAASSSEPYRVLDIQAETGSTGVLGTGAVQAIQYTQDQINHEGGVLGRQVKTDFFDDQGNPVLALSILKRQLASTHYDFIIAGTTSAENNPMLPTITQSKILAMSVAGGVSVAGSANPYFFTGSGIETADPDTLMEYVANKLKDKTVGLLIQSGVAGQTEDAAYHRDFRRWA